MSVGPHATYAACTAGMSRSSTSKTTTSATWSDPKRSFGSQLPGGGGGGGGVFSSSSLSPPSDDDDDASESEERYLRRGRG